MKQLSTFFATLGYSGYFPKAPGTIGSVVALLLAVPILLFGNITIFIIALIALTAIGFWSAHDYSIRMDKKDPKEVVIDELSGMWVTLLVINPHIWWHYLLAFVLFRLFDILKPPPIDILDKKIEGGAGIMVDDLLAGVFAAILFKICIYFIMMT